MSATVPHHPSLDGEVLWDAMACLFFCLDPHGSLKDPISSSNEVESSQPGLTGLNGPGSWGNLD